MSSFETQICVNAYSECYGPESTNEPSIFTLINCGNRQPDDNDGKSSLFRNKEIIFVVDLSESMIYTIPQLKASIKAFRDVIIQDIDDSELPEIHIKGDVKLKNNLDIKVIGYNNHAFKIYPREDFCLDHVVDTDFVAQGLTNIGEGVKLAYSIKNKDKCTWIVVMTDGLPTSGDYTSEKSFVHLKNEAPKNTRIITLGYGKEFSSNILMTLGEFTYIESQELVPVVFGSIANEFKYTWGFNTSWIIGQKDVKIKYIVGKSNFGCLYNEREFICGLAAMNSSEKHLLEKWIQGSPRMILKFTLIQTMEEQKITFNARRSQSRPPEKYREKYYSSAKGRRLKRLSNAMNFVNSNTFFVRELCESIKKDVEKWEEPCSLIHKAEILSFIDRIETMIIEGANGHMYTAIGYESANKYVESSNQTSNTDSSQYTYSQQNIVRETIEASSAYNS